LYTNSRAGRQVASGGPANSREQYETVWNSMRQVSAVTFTIENKEKRQEILKQKEILIIGTATKVVKYLEVSPTTQYTSY